MNPPFYLRGFRHFETLINKYIYYVNEIGNELKRGLSYTSDLLRHKNEFKRNHDNAISVFPFHI